MKTKRISFSVFLWYKIIALSYLFNIILSSALKHNIQKSLTNMIIIVIISVGLTLAAMILTKIIMGNFGHFLHGLLIFLFLNSINYLVAIFSIPFSNFLFPLSYLIGIIFFIIHKKFITFDSSKIIKKEKKIPINKKLTLKILCPPVSG